jgi:short-subunit dehydrogenase
MTDRSRKLDFAGRWVLVTGASSGLGEQLAHQLARRGAKLVLTARRRGRLDAVAREIASSYGVEVTCEALDLSERDAHDELFDRATRQRDIYAVILNAAHYWYGGFDHMPHDEIDYLVRVNLHTPIGLIRRFLPHLDHNGSGGILVIASVGGLIPSPGQSLYSATKAMLVSFIQNLHYERGTQSPVVLSVSSPGGMLTDMMATSPVLAQLRRIPMLPRTMMTPEDVARQSLAAFERGKPSVVPGAHNRLLVQLSRWFPRNLVGKGAALAYGVGGAKESRTW